MHVVRVHEVSTGHPSDTLWTQGPFRGKICPQSVCRESYWQFVDTWPLAREDVPSKCLYRTSHWHCGHMTLASGRCVHKGVCRASHWHFVDTGPLLRQGVSTKCLLDITFTLCWHRTLDSGRCVHKVSVGHHIDTLWTQDLWLRKMFPQSVCRASHWHFVDTGPLTQEDVSTRCL